jgi:hypothetical protein
MTHQQGSWKTFLVKKKCQEDKSKPIKLLKKPQKALNEILKEKGQVGPTRKLKVTQSV